MNYKELLAEFVVANMRFDDAAQEKEFERLLHTEPYKEALAMRDSILDKARKEASQLGQRQLLQTMLESRFGPLLEGALARLESWTGDRLLELGKEIVAGKSLVEMGLED